MPAVLFQGLRAGAPPMSSKGITRVLAAEGVSNFGSMLSRLAIPWLATLTLQASPLQMAALVVADVVAAAVGSLWLGAWVDRSGKRAVMLWCDGLRAASLAGLAALAWWGGLGFATVLIVAALNGLLASAFELARSAWMAQRVAVDELPRRNAQLSALGSVSETLAFALGGWLFQGLGAAWSLAVDAGSYLVSGLCLRGVSEVPGVAAAATGPRPWRQLAQASWAAWRSLRAQPALRTLTRVESLLAFATALSGTSYMIFVSRDLALPTGELGMVFALGGLGAVLGAALAPALGRRLGSGGAMGLGLLACTAGASTVPLATQAGWLALACLALQQVVGDAGHALYGVHDRTWRQTAVPAERLAQVDAGIRAAGQLATLAGGLVGGLAGEWLGARSVLWLAAAVTAAAAALALRSSAFSAALPPPPP